MNKIAVITSSRADYFLLKHLMLRLQESAQLILFVSGELLEGSYLDIIRGDQLVVSDLVECLPKDDSHKAMVEAMATGISNFSDAFNKWKPDMTIVLGDRFEIFSAAIASYSLKIPVAHIHGGEVTHGALDDGFRHAISKLANLHFVSHEIYRQRLLRMGESPDTVHTVGAIGIDNIEISSYQNDQIFLKKFSFLKKNGYFLMTLLPTTLCEETLETQISSVMNALNTFNDFDIVVTQSNRDPGGLYFNKKWVEWAKERKNIHFIPTLGEDYLCAAYNSRCVVGNSSSGILEIPYLNRPVLNIGARQEGRVIPKGVYSVGFNEDAIISTLKKILSTYVESDQLYGISKGVSQKIYDIIVNQSLHNFRVKKFYDAAN